MKKLLMILTISMLLLPVNVYASHDIGLLAGKAATNGETRITDRNHNTSATIRSGTYWRFDLGTEHVIEKVYWENNPKSGLSVQFRFFSSDGTMIGTNTVACAPSVICVLNNPVSGVKYVEFGYYHTSWTGQTEITEIEVYGYTDDKTPPKVPIGLNAIPTNDRVYLTWIANDDPDINGYNVYRDGLKVNATLVMTNSYTDTGLSAGTRYAYTVTAVDHAGNESEHSDQVEVITLTITITPPKNIKAETQGNSIIIRWSPVSDEVSYAIYRDGQKVAYTTTTEYIDNDVSPGITYTYRLSTIADGQESDLSDPIYVSISELGFNKGQFTFDVIDVIATSWSYIKVYSGWIMLVLGIIFAPVAIGYLHRLYSKLPKRRGG